jgi:DNA-binding SARP family transcriptional activator
VVFCLGTFRVHLDGAPVDDWRGGKSRSLLQYLVSHRGRPVSRSTLVRALWPNPDATSPASSLKVAVYALRQTLSQVPGVADRPLWVTSHDTGYGLRAEGLWVDVAAFEHCCAAAGRLEAIGQSAAAHNLYERAVRLYAGDFLPDCPEEWAAITREALIDRYLHALGRLAGAALAAGDYLECVLRCEQILGRDSCREDAYRTLMLCHARLGQRGRVRTWYERCVRALATELDVPPEPETEALYRSLLARPARTPDGLTQSAHVDPIATSAAGTR